MSDPVSGPVYPPAKPSGIGQFVIGVSPIGTIPPFNLWSTIVAQYANSGTLTSLLESWFAALDLTEDFDEFYDLIWNVTTAQGYGLDVWGRIVGVTRVLQVFSAPAAFFGFAEAVSSDTIEGWNQAQFWSGTPLTDNFSLSDAAFRTLIYAKALLNITDMSIPSINRILLLLFPGEGDCYCTDGLDMTMTYTFTFPLNPVQQAIIYESGVLPRPAGVAASVVAP